MLRFSTLSVKENMNVPANIFGKNDIRGLLAEVTPDIARAVGMALVGMTEAKTVVVGRDMRETSPELAQAAIEGITSCGASVRSIDMCTTSMYNFAVSAEDDVGAGLMVTASHNPPQYNGIKMAFHNGLPIPGTVMRDAIQQLPKHSETPGEVVAYDVLPSYLDACLAKVTLPDVSGTKIVIDYGNGMGALSIQPLCERLGLNVVSMYEVPDAHFPNHEANPAKEETLADIKAAVVREGAAFGVALDGDADRIAFIDNEGVSLRGDQTLALLAQAVLAERPGAKIIVAPNQGWAARDAIVATGGEPVEVAVGRTAVIKAMHDTGAILGGELSSHFMFSEFGNLEAVDYAFVRLLAIWKASGKTFADLARPLRTFANSGEVNIEVHDKSAALARISEKYASQATVVNTLDGIRCEFNRDWWFIVRASNTEPILRLIVEAKEAQVMAAHRDELIALIKA